MIRAAFRLLVLLTLTSVSTDAGAVRDAVAGDAGNRPSTISERLTGLSPTALRIELQTFESGDLWRRRAVIVLSLVGIVAMAIVTLFQTGVVRSLPDPPLESFDSNKVNSSDTAYRFGIPDGTIAVLSLTINLPLAAVGGVARAATVPWVPILFGAKALGDAVVGASYFYKMPVVERAWCGYCIVGALVNVAVFLLVVPEALRALGILLG